MDDHMSSAAQGTPTGNVNKKSTVVLKKNAEIYFTSTLLQPRGLAPVELLAMSLARRILANFR